LAHLQSPVLKVLLAAYVIMSFVAFVLYALDKRAAERGLRRTPERTLHLIDLLCGWPGGLTAVYLLRHKSSKIRFKAILWLIVALHAGLWLYLGRHRS